MDSRIVVYTLVLLAGTIIYRVFFYRKTDPLDAPVSGFRSKYEPEFLVRMRWITSAQPIIMDGYKQFKSRIYKVLRNDSDVLVLSNKYIDELRGLPEEELSPMHALLKNVLGHYSQLGILLESNLHTETIQTKLTPQLGNLIGIMEEELDFSISAELPDVDDTWKERNLYDFFVRAIARLSARVFVGLPLCRNEEWLSASIQFTKDVFGTGIALRMVPSFIRPLVAFLVPSVWRARKNVRLAKRFIVPMVNERTQKQNSGDPNYKKPNDFLQWMMDSTRPGSSEGRPEKLAQRQLIMTLASIHTTAMCITHATYDLAARPEYIDILREEIQEVIKADGTLKQSSLGKLTKMDSFLRESQRTNPPGLTAFNRITQTPLTLSDGTRIPKGTHICLPSGPLSWDAELVPNPTTFDGLRFYKQRQDPAQANRFQFATTDNKHIHFGHGKYACPGRFFASSEIKLIWARFLIDYEFKFTDGNERPKNLMLHEYILPDFTAKLMFRKRPEATAS